MILFVTREEEKCFLFTMIFVSRVNSETYRETIIDDLIGVADASVCYQSTNFPLFQSKKFDVSPDALGRTYA